ncbi:universal stress protein [Streptomyces lateritius]|uniref:universal stress protein n=1 Tax=Streptomyces lateritius TaxID=67313 RepID=UPI001C8B4D02|nr:universal stress protein [Streptomyces lateritius]MBX9427014.1 universal stress protein [Streptomyces lateritius]
MSRPVTVGVDGSPESVAAAEWAARESELWGVPLRIVHADERAGVTVPGIGLDARRRWAEELLVATAETVRRAHPSLEIDTRQLSGRPAAALTAEAAEAGLLVLGSRGLSSVRGFFLGSVSMAMICATERPVVLVRTLGPAAARSASIRPSRDVVVGVDINQFFGPLLDFAFQEAARRAGRVLALYGWSIPPVVRDASALAAAEREMGPDIERRLAQNLKPWRRKFPSVDLVERSCVGSPAQLLLHAAMNADLLVVGRRVRGGPLGAHIGSVTHAVIHHCAAPVAVIAHD